MSDSVAVVWDEALLGYTMGGEHPLHPVRLDLTMRLADGLGVLAPGRVEVVRPTPAGEDLLTLVHDPAYLEAVRRAPTHPDEAHGLGTADHPVSEGMDEAAALDRDQAVPLHAGDGLRHRGPRLVQPLRDARPQRDDVLLDELVDRAEVHLGGVDEVTHASHCVPSRAPVPRGAVTQ